MNDHLEAERAAYLAAFPDLHFRGAWTARNEQDFAVWLAARRATSVPAIPGTGRDEEWIETSKRKPEQGQWCIINIRTHYVNAPPRDSVSAARYDGCNWCADGHHLYEPTHWMPFPAAPTHPSEAKAGEDA